ncbi:MAG: ABC transporter permease [Alphaproteobacteria bacterium]|nr:ABC transporter permease [Alphaproteobacteria bacterium]
MGSDVFKSLTWSIASLACLIIIWWVAAGWIDSRNLPGPHEVLNAFTAAAASGELFYHVGVTLARVVVSFFLAMAIGSVTGIVLGRNVKADTFFDSWLVLALNLPALVTIILCYIWFGLTEVAAITAVAINKIPNVAVTVREGAKAVSKELQEMAQAYRFGRWKTLRHVILPQLNPFIAASARSGLALVWKIVLVVELLGRSNGVGFQLHLFFQLFDVASLLAYAIAFIIVVQLIELLILQPWERAANRWRS